MRRTDRATGSLPPHHMRNAGATVLDQPVVIDGHLITSRYPLDLPEMIEALTGALLKAQ